MFLTPDWAHSTPSLEPRDLWHHRKETAEVRCLVLLYVILRLTSLEQRLVYSGQVDFRSLLSEMTNAIP